MTDQQHAGAETSLIVVVADTKQRAALIAEKLGIVGSIATSANTVYTVRGTTVSHFVIDDQCTLDTDTMDELSAALSLPGCITRFFERPVE